ncbi:C-type lectin 37Db-like [Drosophila innubila]|uniref:C-type lectin 37Db-like n=1 Tax=Drosophila innubila TaxID=198719 RepID=UPI00148CA305|nr:C-type lectin 37Db-like [Drosophila innubila]
MRFILSTLLILLQASIVFSQSCLESKQLEENCSSYCFKILRPVLDHAASLQNHINNDDSKKIDSQSKLEKVERQLEVLQGKVETLERVNCKPSAGLQSKKFQKIGSKYYYIEENESVNWFRAVHRCHEMGAHLISLQNDNEFQALKAKLNVDRNYWTDVNDLSLEGEYLSHTTGFKAPFLNWYPSSNPDNKGGNENCVNLWNRQKTLRMNDAPCSSLLNFICEL